ncbi:MAG: hypothetical protein H6908_03295 [Hyphomicrobiales bacterium]|nr:hypothetical protein [Rickettsiales bacterium]MCP5361654.1 hypothetical protein [Hyphomicrobiales bacterium]
MRFRLFHILIFTGAMMLLLRLVDALDRGSALQENWLGRSVYAEEQDVDAEASQAAEEAAKEHTDETSEEGKTDEALTEEGNKDTPKDKAEEDQTFSRSELDILQRLAERREELERRRKEIEVKENVLRLTQERINTKIDELRTLKDEVAGLLNQYNDKENTKIKSLVKIYENMKPKDAAEIFEGLDMHTLLEVISQMSERKIAPILALMTPERAKELTIQYATRQRLKDDTQESRTQIQ